VPEARAAATVPEPGADATPPPAPAPPPSRWASVLVWTLLFAAGLAVRIAPWHRVFGDGEVRFVVDADPHYHVLRSERMLRGDPGAPWRDPGLDWPHGADITWPPLFDATIAAGARLTGGPAPGRAEVARAAAFLPVLLGLLAIAAAGVVGALLLGRAGALGAALGCALLPASVEAAKLGRPDQHVAEQLLWLVVLGSLALAVRRPGRRAAAAAVRGIGAGAALSFLTWQGSAFALVVPAAFLAAVHVLDARGADPAARRATIVWALGCALGAVLLAAAVLAWGVPGGLRWTDVRGVGGLHVAILAGNAAFAGLLAALPRLRAGAGLARRALEVALALALPLLATLAVSPALRAGAARGLVALFASSPWYAAIIEFRPMLFTGIVPLRHELIVAAIGFGFSVPFALASLPALLRAAARSPADRARPVLAALAFVVPLGLALARQRFGPYLVVPASLLAGEAIRSWAGWVGRRFESLDARRAAVAAGALLSSGRPSRSTSTRPPSPPIARTSRPSSGFAAPSPRRGARASRGRGRSGTSCSTTPASRCC